MAMKVIKWVISSVILLCVSVSSFSQDMHFSMFDAAPIYYNPALVGKGECDHRFMLNSKTQWSVYNIFSFSYDFNLPDKINQVLPTPLGGHWAAGAMITADPSGEFNFMESKIMLMPAYHMPIGKIDLSTGLNIALIKTSINQDRLILENHGDGDVVRPELDNTGSFKPDVSFGANAGTYIKNKYPLNIGGTIHHIYTPEKGMIDGEKVGPKPRRLSFNANTEIPLDTNNSIVLMPSAILYYQDDNTVINGGSLARFNTDKMSQSIPNVYAGVFMRFSEDSVYFGIPEAAIFAVGFDLSVFKNGQKVTAQGAEKKTGDLRILFSFDLTMSDLVEYGKGNSFELSLKYTFCNKKFDYTPPFRLNPIFN